MMKAILPKFGSFKRDYLFEIDQKKTDRTG